MRDFFTRIEYNRVDAMQFILIGLLLAGGNAWLLVVVLLLEFVPWSLEVWPPTKDL